MDLKTRYLHVNHEIAQYCMSIGRNPDEVCVVAVSKMVGLSMIEEAVSAGIKDLGENRSDSLHEKQKAYPQCRWHFIGNIQSRKIPEIVASAHLIHSVYQPQHLRTLDLAAAKLGKVQNILAEVNVLGEATKAGLAPGEVEDFITQVLAYDHIKIKGFMTMAPQGDLLRARTCFDSLAHLRSEMKTHFSGSIDEQDLHELSMGMSEDWRQAIDAGATIVRIGRAIFDDMFVETL